MFEWKIHMDQRLRELLKEIEEHGRENDARATERPRMMLNLERLQHHLAGVVARASRRSNRHH
jgi:hypothetical protein